jgi:hypothetical protein
VKPDRECVPHLQLYPQLVRHTAHHNDSVNRPKQDDNYTILFPIIAAYKGRSGINAPVGLAVNHPFGLPQLFVAGHSMNMDDCPHRPMAAYTR